MRVTGALLLLVSLASFASAKYEGYQVWRLKPTTEEQRDWLSGLQDTMEDELDFWTDVFRIPGHPVDIMVRPKLQATLRSFLEKRGVDYHVMIGDVTGLISNQMSEIKQRREAEAVRPRVDTFDYNVYHPYDEIQQWVEDIASEHSNIVSTFVLGQSYEGRQINGIKIHGTGGPSTTRPAVWFEGGIHAREWVSPSTVIGFTKLLLDEYAQGDDLATRMFDNVDWYIVPSLNADGYVYTWTTERLWRKTRSPNPRSSCVGTDPNRNWPYEWGGVGTSPYACSETYKGSEALSEIEVANVVNFVREKKLAGQDFKVFIDWHSYSQVIIAPWSYLDEKPRTPDYDDQMAMATEMTNAILATHGQSYGQGAGAEILYPASGSSKDYGYAAFSPAGPLYGGLDAKYSYTVELRDTGSYGFLLPENQIQDTYEEIHAAVRAIGARILNEI